MKTKSLRDIEDKMQGLDKDSLRYRVLESAKNFKTSWIDLGRYLYCAWKDKLYKEWGYSKMETYAAKEIGIRKVTAMKLLRSYYFLEKEEPDCLKGGYLESKDAAKTPTYEAIDLLRKAKDKKILDSEDYVHLRKDILEGGKDALQARRDLTTLIRGREELEPQEAYRKRRLATVKRFLGTLKALRREIEVSKLLPAAIIKEAADLIDRLEDELS